MEHPGEIWQEADFNGEIIGGIDPNDFDEQKIKRFNGVAVMLYRYNDGDVEYLFQHRSKNLRDSADKWDVSAGGHVNVDECRIEAIVRETKEEIGIDLDISDLEFVATYLRWKIFVGLYFYDWTGKEDNFLFNDEEVEEVKWIKHSELDAFWLNLKWTISDDIVFEYYLDEWNKKVIEKYENYGHKAGR